MNLNSENIQSWWSQITFSAPQKRSLLAISALVIALSVFLVIRGNSQEVPTAPIELAITAETAEVTVDVAGAVNTPGVYALPINSRVIDALKAAGNAMKGADISDINLARIIKDGEQIYIYPPSKSGGPIRIFKERAKPKPAGPIFINRANTKELETLDGIGPVLAARIVAYRSQNGAFINLEDLLKVSGIGPATLAKFKEKIRI
ncbi:MAG: ComEA family DNA-binding protein [Candidatus Planktophila sp.]|mgnify:CR=1 FL=1|jgi:competence protein ComEA|tara:strand:- start:3090 stop:3704 length:615 start_codon:yes stop_codon:yes gene_type:complete